MTCETCKYWKRHDTNKNNWGAESKANPDDFGQCTQVKFAYWQETGEHPFYVMDGSEYLARLDTRRDFSCNQHVR